MKSKASGDWRAFHRRDARSHDDFEASLVLELRQVRQIALKLRAERFAFLQTSTAITTHRKIFVSLIAIKSLLTTCKTATVAAEFTDWINSPARLRCYGSRTVLMTGRNGLGPAQTATCGPLRS
jgi:hypothetical protein